MVSLKISSLSPDWTDAVFGERRCVIRALIVTDGKLDFLQGVGFNLSLLRDALEKSALPWETIKITTAYRGAGTGTGADLHCFKFDSVDGQGKPVFSIDLFDQVWLFGADGEDEESISPSEIAVITTFMSNGGGVFATGDHEDLGFALCGSLPRVRKMRRWYFKRPPRNEVPAPAVLGPTRIDSLREGMTLGFQTRDEEDEVPQEIRAKFFINKFRTAAEPHPLLAIRNFAITVLPDHMHEGECVSPREIERKLSCETPEDDDFPTPSSATAPVLPEVVAIATSAGGMFSDNDPVFPVEPRCYIIISAYDGHAVEQVDPHGTPYKLGRVVVDASFHHFLNLNLCGFFRNNQPTKDFEIICKYYRNILTWLLPPSKQLPYYLHLLLGLRYSPPLLEEIRKRPVHGLSEILHAGKATNRAIQENLSGAEARLCALALGATQVRETQRWLKDLIDLWRPSGQSEESPAFLNSDESAAFFDSEKVLWVVLGGAMQGIASSLPESPFGSSKALTQFEKDNINLTSMARTGVYQGLALFQNAMRGLSKSIHILSETIANPNE